MDTPLLIPSLLAIGYILFAFLVPTKRSIEAYKNAQVQAQRRVSNTKPVECLMSINGLAFERGYVTGFVKPSTMHASLIFFEDVYKGAWSQTLFLTVDLTGEVTAYNTEAQAQRSFQKDMLGIVAVTLSKNDIRFRDILPDGVESKNMYSVKFQFGLGSR